MSRVERITAFISVNRWIIIASLFFIVWKFFLIGVMWDGRSSPPEPDDSYIYIGNISSVSICDDRLLCDYPTISTSNYTGFTYLSYRLIFGSIAKAFDIEPATLFHASFYFGTLFLLPILIFFLSAMTKNRDLVALSVFFLALYNGSGAYHGFFWVVPSFFSVALFLLIFAIIASRTKYWLASLAFIVPIFVYMHPMSIYAIAIPVFYLAISSIIRGKIRIGTFKRVAYTTLIAALSYLPMAIYLNGTPQKNPLGVMKAVETIRTSVANIGSVSATAGSNAVSTTLPGTSSIHGDHLVNVLAAFQSMPSIYENYLLWLFPHWIAILPFVITILLLFRYGQTRLLSLYLSLVFFVLVSSIDTFGSRSLIFIWPVTFVLYAFGFWYLIRFIDDTALRNKTIPKGVAYLGLALFIGLNIVYSVFWNQHVNKRDNIRLNPDFATYIIDHTDKNDHIFYASKTLQAYSLNTGLIERAYAESPESAKYAAMTADTENATASGKTGLDTFYDIMAKVLQKQRTSQQERISEPIPSGYILEKEFGSVRIYKNNEEN